MKASFESELKELETLDSLEAEEKECLNELRKEGLGVLKGFANRK